MMWQYNAMIALDLARDRAAEARRAADLARIAREAAGAGQLVDAPRGRLRATLAAPVRIFSRVAHVIADAACTAATRIEGRTA